MRTFMDVDRTTFPRTAHEWSDRMNASGQPSTGDDQSRTWDGRVLDTKGAVLDLLVELEATRHDGRSLEPMTMAPEPSLDLATSSGCGPVEEVAPLRDWTGQRLDVDDVAVDVHHDGHGHR